MPKLILIYSPTPHGGLAEHTFYQAEALVKLGAHVVCLTSPSFLPGRIFTCEINRRLLELYPDVNRGTAKRIKLALRLVINQFILAIEVLRLRPALVLLESYVEYLSPIWIWPHIFLSLFSGVAYAANLHDPVRNFRVGPRWWHRLSMAMAYWPLDVVLIHHKAPNEANIPARVSIVEVPVGIYNITSGPVSREETRRIWGVRDSQAVFLAFGFVRDGKNLDLAIRALKSAPNAFLVIAGSVASTKDKAFPFYKRLAEEIGVRERCFFHEGFVPDEDLGKFFLGTDFILLTYSSNFHSQSGVLNVAARARKPVLASAAPGPLTAAVREYFLGISVAADSEAAVAEGMNRLTREPVTPAWDRYEASAAWELNVRRLLESTGLVRPNQSLPTTKQHGFFAGNHKDGGAFSHPTLP